MFEGCTYPWEVLAKIGDFIVELGNSLPEDEYEKRGENIWVHRTANVFPSAYIAGPAIIGKDAEVRHCAFIRGKAIVGEGAVVGNSTELKNVILFNKVQVPHYNYVGDSILGFKAHMGAGSITSNVSLTRSLLLLKDLTAILIQVSKRLVLFLEIMLRLAVAAYLILEQLLEERVIFIRFQA